MEEVSPDELLAWYAEAGVDVALCDEPVNRFEETRIASEKPTQRQAVPKQAKSQRNDHQQSPSPPASETRTIPDEAAVEKAINVAQSASTLDELREAILSFDACNLKLTARSTLFGEGNADSPLMIIGEAPEREEDEHATPFVGASGQLLDRMLAAINLDRSSVYLANALPWRPPGNRTPTPMEIKICRPFLLRHVELTTARVILSLGALPTTMLLDSTKGIMMLRGRWHEINREEQTVPLLPSLHPNYLLRQPLQKKIVWRDLLQIAGKIAEATQET